MSELTFHKYPSLILSDNEKILSIIYNMFLHLPEVEWRVDEKIHGCNVSFFITKDEVYPARRTAILGQNESFHSLKEFTKENRDLFLSLFEKFNKEIAVADIVVLYGELYGGYKNKKHSTIQREVIYAEEHRIKFFDIAYKTGSDEKELSFLDKDMADKFITDCGFDVVPPLFTGTFEDCVKYSNSHLELPTTMCDIKEYEEPNTREGHIIRPIKFTRANNGKVIILKHKGEKFTERKKNSKPVAGQANINNALSHLAAFVTDQRFNNIQSRHEPFTNKDIGLVVKEMFADIKKDVMEDNDSDVWLEIKSKLSEKDLTTLEKKVKGVISALVRKKVL